MNLFDDIQSDIVGNASLTTILRKAKVLAYRLGNEEFKSWVDSELSGYQGSETSFPDYRKIQTNSIGNFENMAWRHTNQQIPISVLPDDLQEKIRIREMRDGIKELESLVQASSSEKGKHQLSIPWEAELVMLFNNRADPSGGYMLTAAQSTFSTAVVEQILDDVRNRLLGFILELAERYPEQAKAGFENASSIPNEQIRSVFEVKVMGSGNIITPNALVSQGGNMSIFDQRNQSVKYQYNAAGNINFDSVKTRKALITELEKLKTELSMAAGAKAIKEDIVTDAEYQITKAIQQSQKPSPSKKTILQHINKAKALIGTVTKAAGMVTALTQAADLVQKLFK